MTTRKVHTFRADPDIEEFLQSLDKYYKSHHINQAIKAYMQAHPNAHKE